MTVGQNLVKLICIEYVVTDNDLDTNASGFFSHSNLLVSGTELKFCKLLS